MKYNCDLCKYETDHLSHINKHYKSQKHMKNVNMTKPTSPEKVSDLTDNIINCAYCGIKRSLNNIARHIKTCPSKLKHDDELEQIKKDYDELKNQTKIKDNDLRMHQNYIAKKDNDIRTKDDDIRRKDMILEGLIKLCNYDKVPVQQLLETFAPTAPNLIEFNDMEKFKKNLGNDNLDIVQIAIHYERRNELHKYVGEVLVNEYHCDKLHQQSIHVTDEQRNNYHIRTNNIWKIDKKGKQMQIMTIDPIINGLKGHLEKFIELNKNKPHEYLRKGENGLMMKITEDLATCGIILSSIDNNLLKTKVITYLKKYLNFDRKMFIEGSIYENEHNFKDMMEKKEFCIKSKKYRKQRKEIEKINTNFVDRYNVLVNDICVLDRKLDMDEKIKEKSKEIAIVIALNRLNGASKDMIEDMAKEKAKEIVKELCKK